MEVGGVGVEPTMFLCNGFTVRRPRPLGIPTLISCYYTEVVARSQAPSHISYQLLFILNTQEQKL